MIPVLDNLGDDMISELRLRQWARRNYLPPEHRNTDLHPIVRSEMEFRDRELAAERPEWTMVRTPFVPLLPGDLSIDSAHSAVPAPFGVMLPNRSLAHNSALS